MSKQPPVNTWIKAEPSHITQSFTRCWCSLPVDGERHFLHASLYLVLSLQVSHALRRLPVDGQNYVSDAQVGLGRFASRVDLRKGKIALQKTQVFYAFKVRTFIRKTDF